MDFQRSSEIIVCLAQELVSMVRRSSTEWTHAYWRFESEDARYGSNGSYETSSAVVLFDTLKEHECFEALNALGRELWELERNLKKQFCVCLLATDSSLNYELKYEREDISKWRITKLNGASGRPAGWTRYARR